MYQVVDRSGAVHGPVPIDTLRQWVAEGRLFADMTVIEVATSQQGPAGQLLAQYGLFVSAPASQGFAGNVAQSYQQAQQAFPQAEQQYGFQGSDEAGKVPRIGPRAAAFLVDFLLSVSIIYAIDGWSSLLLRDFEHGWIAYMGYGLPFLVAVYYLFRDAAFPGQSIGKRIAKIRVINVQQGPANILQSVLRNIVAAPLILMPIPYVGKFVIMPLVSLAFLIETFMVLTTGKRLCDAMARTLVVNE